MLFRKITQLVIIVLIATVLSKQTFGQDFKQHELLYADNGIKIEILKCSINQNFDTCDVIIFKEKRQDGKRKKIATTLLNILRQAKDSSQEISIEQYTKILKQIDSLYLIKDTLKRFIPIGIVKNKKPLTLPDSSGLVTNTVQKAYNNDTVINTTKVVSTVTSPDPKIKTSTQNTISVTTTVSPPQKNASVVTTVIQPQDQTLAQPDYYTLEQCYSIGLSKNIKINQLRNGIDIATIDKKSAKTSIYPSVSYDLGHYFSFGKNIDPVTNNFSFETFSGGFTSLNLQMQLFGGFKKLNAIKQSSYLLDAAQYNEKKNELELMTNITITYANILLINGELANIRNNIAKTKNEILVIDEKIKVGRLTRYEKYTFEGLLNTQISELVSFQNDSTTANNNLKQLLNLPASQTIHLAPIDTVLLNDVFETTFTVDDVGDKIISNHPTVRIAETNEKIAEYAEKIAKASLMPSLVVSGNIVSNYNSTQEENNQKISLSRQLNNNLGQNINISLRIPVFSQLQYSNRVKKERINIINAQLEVENARNLIRTNTILLINDFNTAKQRLTATQQSYNQNKLSYDMYYEKYKLGQVSSVELLAAQTIFNTSASKYLQAKLQLMIQYKMLQLLQKS